MKISSIFFLAIVATFVMSCCYSFNLNPLGDVKSIYIPLGENNTTKAGLSETISDKFTTKFTTTYSIDTRNSASAADAVLEVTVLSYNNTWVAFTSSDQITRSKITIQAQVVLKKSSGKELLNKTVIGETTYDNSTVSEDDAIPNAVDNLVDKFFKEFNTNW